MNAVTTRPGPHGPGGSPRDPDRNSTAVAGKCFPHRAATPARKGPAEAVERHLQVDLFGLGAARQAGVDSAVGDIRAKTTITNNDMQISCGIWTDFTKGPSSLPTTSIGNRAHQSGIARTNQEISARIGNGAHQSGNSSTNQESRARIGRGSGRAAREAQVDF